MVRVNFLVSGVLYIRGSSKFHVFVGSLYSWFEQTSWDRVFFIFVVRVNFLVSWVLFFVVRVNFLVSWVLYIRGSSKLPGIVGSLYSWLSKLLGIVFF